MPKFRLSRRDVLKGAGGLALALPFLEIMEPVRGARAAAQTARRFLSVYTPGGTILANWRPTGTETSFVMGPILAPLAPLQDRLIVVDGVDMKSAQGEQSQSGMVAWLTGTNQAGTAPFGSQGPSIDQVLAARPEAASRRLSSLQLAVRWGTGRSHGRVEPRNIVNYGTRVGFPMIAPRLDPTAIWQELFGPTPSAAFWGKSMLDFVDRRYVGLSRRLGAADKMRLDAHLTAVRALERKVSQCAPAPLGDVSGYDPLAGLKATDSGTGPIGAFNDPVSDAAIPKVGKIMMDMLVMAFSCDLTSVASFQWSDSEACYTVPWLNLPQQHSFYENDGGFHPPELTTIYTWYASQHAYLLQQMANVDMGGHSLLDESVVFFGSELQHPATYQKDNMPFLLAGGGGMRTGRWLQCGNQSHNNLLVSILNLFGDARTTFGDPRFCTGPLTQSLV